MKEVKGFIEEVRQKKEETETHLKFIDKDGNRMGFGVVYSKFGKLGDKIALIVVGEG